MTADERALVEAIIAAPDDDLPRLVYADWLEEHGRETVAELLRSEGHRAGGDPHGLFRLWAAYPDLAGRLVYVPASTPAIINAVRCGIVFFMAWWSGPARQAFAAIMKAIRECDPDERLLVVVLDVDGTSGKFDREFPELGPLNMGCGQTLWLARGQVVRLNRFGVQTEHLRDYTDELLAACRVANP